MLLGINRFQLHNVQDVEPCKYKNPNVVYFRKLDDNLNKRSKTIKSSSTTDAEAIEMIEMTSKDIDTTVRGMEQDTSFIKPDYKDTLLSLRALVGLDKQLRTIRRSLKAAVAKRIELEGRIEHEERKLNEIQDPTHSDDQRSMIEDRIKNLETN